MKFATLEQLRKYVGTKIKVYYRAVTNVYEYKGIMQQFEQGYLVIKEHEGIKEKAFTDIAVKIKLLEPITIPIPRTGRSVTFEVGEILSVGEWQVKPLKEKKRGERRATPET